MACPAYVPRPGNGTVLHAVVREHRESLLAEVSAGGGGHDLPAFVRLMHIEPRTPLMKQIHGVALPYHPVA